jgi:hypothetical protein
MFKDLILVVTYFDKEQRAEKATDEEDIDIIIEQSQSL